MSENYKILDTALDYLNEGTIDESKLEVLTEDLVCKDSFNNIHIGIFPDENRNFEEAPYFKVSWKSINRTNQDVARIDMRTGDYIVHFGKSVELSSKIVDQINLILSDETKKYLVDKYNTGDVKNGWEGLLKATAAYTNNQGKFEEFKTKFPKIQINPNSSTLKGYTVIKWGK